MKKIICILIIGISKESLRFQYTIEQGFDTSCGMSVAAIALDRYWGGPTDELQLITSALGERLEGLVGRDSNLIDINSELFGLHVLTLGRGLDYALDNAKRYGGE